MWHINSLLSRAKKINVSGRIKNVLGFVNFRSDTQKYEAKVNLLDGIVGSGGEWIFSEHGSKEEAITACHAIAAKYPEAVDIILVQCYGDVSGRR